MCVCVCNYLASVNKQKFCILNGLRSSEISSRLCVKETKKRSHWVGLGFFFGYGGTVISLPLLHDNAQAGE